MVAIVQPWKGSLGPIETAKLLEHRLKSSDEFDCREPSGLPVAGEPDWDFLCEDVSHPARQSYLVKTSGKRISDIAPAG